VLRDPQERIASLYFYFRARAEALTEQELALPENLYLARARHWTADDCFFGGDAEWQARIRDVCDNVYCSYFGTRRVGGTTAFRALPEPLLRRLLESLEDVKWAEPGNDGEVRVEAERAAAVVARLRPDQRKVLRMGLLEGMTHSEIATATGMPLGTVKTQMRRGLIQVRQWMKIENPIRIGEATP
jgi:DNA-directed RNA polymerase specialized sigma24 family protein